MLNIDRQKLIIDRLYQKGSVRVSELSQEMDVSEETIRRDLKSLAGKWDLEIVYGGAVLKNKLNMPSVVELNMQSKRSRNFEEKQLIAKKAASLINPGDTIGLNSGSTVEYILDYLEGKTPLNIVTLNVHIASKAIMIDGVDVYVPAGHLRTKSGSVIGHEAGEYLKGFAIDKFFCGISALNLGKGICHPNIEEVPGNQAMLSASQIRYVVTDSSKVNQSAPFKMIDLNDIDGFIVDENFPEEYREYMELHDITVI